MCPTLWFYLAEIYRLQEKNPWVTLSLLAEGMDVSLQAASRMIRQMVENGHVIHEPYRGVRLTPEGERIALQVIRRHRLLEAFMVRVMGFGWDEVHDLVDTIERGVIDKIIDRMEELAGYPTRCPHGEPIPSREGVMPHIEDRPLPEWPDNTPARISRVKTHDPEKLRYLASVDLVPGVILRISARTPFNGPLHLSRESGALVVGYDLAHELYVDDGHNHER